MKNKLSRLLVIVLAITLAISSLPVFTVFAAETVFSVRSKKIVLEGEYIDVSFSVQGNPGISAYKFVITFDPSLTLVSAESGEALQGKGSFDSKSSGNTVTVMWFCASSDVSENGEIAALRFMLPEGAVAGDTFSFTASCDPEDILNSNIEEVPFSLKKGIITLCDSETYSTMGDADGDGEVTTRDVLLIRKYLGGLVDEDRLNLEAADVDHDGEVTTRDVLKIRKYLGGLIDELD